MRGELLDYIQREIFPIYSLNDEGHNLDHINYVIERSLKFAKQFKDINLEMVYVIASYHDVAAHIDRKRHEELSAEFFYNDEKMKDFFSDEERIVIKEAIEDHRASAKKEPRSDYGKIVSSADRSVDLDNLLVRTYQFRANRVPRESKEVIIDECYAHLIDKYGPKGYASSYVYDEEYEKFKQETYKLCDDKNLFIERFIKVNKI